MRSKAPESVLVLPNLSQVDAQPIQIEYLAELTFLYHLAQPLDGGMVDQEVAGQHRDASLRGLPGDRLSIPYAQGERLLDQDRFAGRDNLSSNSRMCSGRRRHDDGIHDSEQRRHV